MVRSLNSGVLRVNWQHGKDEKEEKRSSSEDVCGMRETSGVALQKQPRGQILQKTLSPKVEGKQQTATIRVSYRSP